MDFINPTASTNMPLYTLKTITGRAGLPRLPTCDFEMDTADKDRKIRRRCSFSGARGPDRSTNFLDVWRRYATTVAGEGLPSGHYIQEEIPDAFISISPNTSSRGHP